MHNKPNENFRLLDMSSDQESSDLQLEIIPRKKKATRRERNRNITKTIDQNVSEFHCALRWALKGTLVLWLVVLTWLCASLYDQVTAMRSDITKVSTSSDGVGDALQLCHTAAKELRANVTYLSSRLDKLEQLHLELSKRVEQATGDLDKVSSQLSSTPNLADTPRRLAELQRTVANFGSQINGFDSSIQSAHKQALAASTAVDEVRTSLHMLEGQTNDTMLNVTANAKHIDELRHQLQSDNSSLSARVDTLQTKIDEAMRTTSTAVPTSTSSTVTSSQPTPATSPSTTSKTTTPGSKPVLLDG